MSGDITRRTAYALALWPNDEWPNDEVPRATIRALLPRGVAQRLSLDHQYRRFITGGQRSGSRNRVSDDFGTALNKFARAGWITRTETHIHIHNRDALKARAFEGLDLIPVQFKWIEDAAAKAEQKSNN
jgi:hypothetical protein